MIFHCPACSAGHTVPVSMIPNGGMDMTCRRCSASFLVDVDEPAVVEEEDPTVAAKAEATAIGVANPYDELVPDAQLIRPGGELLDLDDSSDDTEALVAAEDRARSADKPTIPIDHKRVPLGPDEVGVDPEIDNTQRFDVEEEDVPTYEPDVIGMQDIDGGGLGASRPPSRRAPTPEPRKLGASKPEPSSSSTRPPFDRDDLYAKVASGRYEKPEAPPEPVSNVPRERAWNEPSSLIFTGAGSTSALRRFAEWLNRAPLPLKVALIVFPVTLGLTLVLTAGPKRGDPVEVGAVGSVDSTQTSAGDVTGPGPGPGPEAGTGSESGAGEGSESGAGKGSESGSGEGSESGAGKGLGKGLGKGSDSDSGSDSEADTDSDTVARSRSGPGPGPGGSPGGARFRDPTAAEGQAYIQAPNTRLRATAAPRGRTVARLAAGQLVQRYDRRGDFALVLVAPDGPVGFVDEGRLGAQKPIVALAEDIAFEGCSSTGSTLDACLFEAKQKEGACVDGCGADGARCREACQIAFERCTRQCQPPKRRRRRRR
ncbi:MAG: zinc-ribbon domain-containing protein [Deltaproteobacteria bacterium]